MIITSLLLILLSIVDFLKSLAISFIAIKTVKTISGNAY